MTTPDSQAPIFTQSWDLTVWLLKKARAEPHDPLARSLAVEALRLIDVVTLALKNIEREESLADADMMLVRLRTRLRLAMETELLTEHQGLHALRETDSIGRQIGGWLKAL